MPGSYTNALKSICIGNVLQEYYNKGTASHTGRGARVFILS